MTGASGIFYRTFHDHDTRVSMKVKQSQNISVLNSNWLRLQFHHICTDNGNVE